MKAPAGAKQRNKDAPGHVFFGVGTPSLGFKGKPKGTNREHTPTCRLRLWTKLGASGLCKLGPLPTETDPLGFSVNKCHSPASRSSCNMLFLPLKPTAPKSEQPRQSPSFFSDSACPPGPLKHEQPTRGNKPCTFLGHGDSGQSPNGSAPLLPGASQACAFSRPSGSATSEAEGTGFGPTCFHCLNSWTVSIAILVGLRALVQFVQQCQGWALQPLLNTCC